MINRELQRSLDKMDRHRNKRINGSAHGISGRALLECDMPEPVLLCDPWCPEGLLLNAGRPKVGKTTLLRQKAVAMGNGADFFGSPCKRAKVLFVSLEENSRLMRKKLKMAGYTAAEVENIEFYFDWPRGLEGAERLAEYLSEHPDVRYVVIDSLTRIRELPDQKKPAFIADYEAMQHLHSILTERPGIAIEVLHHTRKAKSDDPIDDISGTYGLTAACDGYFVMRHHAEGVELHVGGRLWDRDDSKFMLKRSNQRWLFDGVADDLTGDQRYTLDLLKHSGGMKPSELAKAR